MQVEIKLDDEYWLEHFESKGTWVVSRRTPVSTEKSKCGFARKKPLIFQTLEYALQTYFERLRKSETTITSFKELMEFYKENRRMINKIVEDIKNGE